MIKLTPKIAKQIKDSNIPIVDITLEDLKKWNDISGSEIKPGMALSLKPRS